MITLKVADVAQKLNDKILKYEDSLKQALYDVLMEDGKLLIYPFSQPNVSNQASYEQKNLYSSFISSLDYIVFYNKRLSEHDLSFLSKSFVKLLLTHLEQKHQNTKLYNITLKLYKQYEPTFFSSIKDIFMSSEEKKSIEDFKLKIRTLINELYKSVQLVEVINKINWIGSAAKKEKENDHNVIKRIFGYDPSTNKKDDYVKCYYYCKSVSIGSFQSFVKSVYDANTCVLKIQEESLRKLLETYRDSNFFL